MSFPRTAWVNLNRQQTGVGRFHMSMYKWDLAPLSNCECGVIEQNPDHVLITSSIHRAPYES